MPEVKKLLLIGAGGHCKSIIDSLLVNLDYNEIGIVANDLENGRIMGIPVLGNDSHLEKFYSQGYKEAFVAVGSVGDSGGRNKLFSLIKQIGFRIPNIIDSTSIISGDVILGKGIYIGKNAVVNTGTQVGDGAILNTSCVVEHECTIGDMVHIAPGSILCGKVSIGNGAHIGAGSVIKQGIHIGQRAIVGMGSVVLSDINGYVTAYGNPCKEVCNG